MTNKKYGKTAITTAQEMGILRGETKGVSVVWGRKGDRKQT
jgi:hypothetical protein